MRFRVTSIAMAVAGTIAAPAEVQAGADEIYASARIGAWFVDSKGTADTEVQSFASRFGMRGESDLGNGLTGFGRYEWDVDDDTFQVRHRYVGLRGDYGSVRIGKAHHTFFTFVVGPFDKPWWHSGYAMIDYVSRTDKGITYSGASDNFAYGATAYMFRESEENSIDRYEFGASFTFDNDIILGAGMIGTEADEDKGTGWLIGNRSDKSVYGVSLSNIALGDFGLDFNAQSQDDDTSFGNNIGYGNFYLHTELEFIDKDSSSNPTGDNFDRSSFTLGYTQGLGRRTVMWYELNYIDNDTGDSDDNRTAIMAVLKYDII